MSTIHYAFADEAGKIVKCGSTPDWDSLRAKRETWPGFNLVIDRHAPRPINPNTDSVVDGKIIYGDPPPPVATVDDVRRFTSTMIRKRFDRDDQMNAVIEALDDGDIEAIREIKEHVRQIRAAGKRLRAMSPIPLDFRDPKYWTVTP